MKSVENTLSSETDFGDAILINEANFTTQKNNLPWFARKFLKLLLRIESGKLFLKFPNGKSVEFDSGNQGPIAKIHLHNWKLPRKVALSGTIGVAESYMDEDWDSPDVTSMLEFFLVNRSIYG